MSVETQSKAYKLSVHLTMPGALSHILNCYCKTVGKPAEIEKAYTLKKVNYYRFKEYVETVMKVPNFSVWYLETKGRIALSQALSDYINHSEKRVRVFSATTLIDRKINDALLAVKATNMLLQSMLTV